MREALSYKNVAGVTDISREIYDLVIVGAGASGMVCGIAAASYCVDKNFRIAVVERHKTVGRKIAATGNGQCNISNFALSNSESACDYFYGSSRSKDLAALVVKQFGVDELEKFMEDCGVLISCDSEGRFYPMSRQASSVRDALSSRLDELGVEILTNHDVLEVIRDDFENKFALRGVDPEGDFEIFARKVVLANGGKSYPKLSSDGSGYILACGLGHSLTKLSQGIVKIMIKPFCSDSLTWKQAEGTKTSVVLKLIDKACGKCVTVQEGEMLITVDGLSGPPVLQLAGFMEGRIGDFRIEVDVLPRIDVKMLAEILMDRVIKFPRRGVLRVLDGILPDKVGQIVLAVMAGAGFRDFRSKIISDLTVKDIAGIVAACKALRSDVTGLASWDEAQVTCGGISCSEFDAESFESNFCKGLYVVGELLDVQGMCGGFNLHFAIGSGFLSGRQLGESYGS